MSNLVRLKNYDNAIDANREKQILAENGIESYIADDFSSLIFSFQGFNLMVFENDFAKALEVLESFQQEIMEPEVEHTIKSATSNLLCPKCNSNNIYYSAGLFTCYYCSNEWAFEQDPNYRTGGSI